MHLLAPYGSMKFLPLSTKVGGTKPDAPLAPYGDLEFLATVHQGRLGRQGRSGSGGEIPRPLRLDDIPAVVDKVGLQKPGDDPVAT